MGKKHQRDREERRERYASRQQKQNTKNKMVAIGVFAGIAVIVGYAGYQYTQIIDGPPGGPDGAGPINSAHIHAGMLVKIFGDKFDFSQPSYQIKTPWIHFEGHNGETIHRHATGVDLGYMFESLSIDLSDECFIFPNAREYCTDDKYTLKFFINGEQVDSILNYVVEEDDRVLVVYGEETDEEIDLLIQEANSLVLDIRG